MTGPVDNSAFFKVANEISRKMGVLGTHTCSDFGQYNTELDEVPEELIEAMESADKLLAAAITVLANPFPQYVVDVGEGDEHKYITHTITTDMMDAAWKMTSAQAERIAAEWELHESGTVMIVPLNNHPEA